MENSRLDQSPYYWQNLKINFRVNSVDTDIIRHSFDNDIFYSQIKEFRPKQKMNIIDVGAHIGTFSMLSAVKFPDAKIYSFEPFAETYNLLKQNIDENNIVQVETSECAISNRNKQVKLYLGSENWEHSTVNTEASSSIVVRGKKLDTFIDEKNIESIDLIKFNCEGAEFEIIKSISSKTFKKIKFMVILFHEDMAKELSRVELTRVLKENNFMFREANTSLKRGWIIAKNSNYYSKNENLIISLKTQIRTNLYQFKIGMKKAVVWIIKR